MIDEQDQELTNKWRLVLGKYAKDDLEFSREDSEWEAMEEVLDQIYSHEYSEDEQHIRGSSGGNTTLSVPTWLAKVKELFPKKTVEVIERHALERYHMTEFLTNPEVLEQMEPNRQLLRTILEMKHLMKGEVLELAKRIVKQVAEEIQKQLEQDMRLTLQGMVNRMRQNNRPSARNLNIKKTVERNLKNYDVKNRRLVLDKVYFNTHQSKFNNWKIIICVDESTSMTDSVIHSAIMASIFAKLPMLDTRLIIFADEIVDLSEHVGDTLEILMSVRLGGGTNINGALQYSSTLIDNPARTMVVLVTDLFEGHSYKGMYSKVGDMIEAGTKLIVLTALDRNANPNYDRKAGEIIANMGAFVGAMTPEQMTEYVGDMIK